jgi:histidinol-phosphate/aromatic aminotransferase/cobyric acid decarboxylase-like protein
VTNFLLVDFKSPGRAERMAHGLLRRGIVPRTFGQGHPLVDHLRFTVRAPAEDDRLLEAAREIAREIAAEGAVETPAETPAEKALPAARPTA